MRGMLLDLDDTLLDNKGAMAKGFSEFCAIHKHLAYGTSERELLAKWHELSDRHWARYETGELSFQEQRRYRIREFLDIDLDDQAADSAFRIYRQGYEAGWRLLPGVAEFLARTRHIPKVIITNGNREVQVQKVRVTGLDLHVIGIITPGDCGHWKPDSKIFEAAIAMLQIAPGECLVIGDDYARDIAPAIEMGMPHFHLKEGVSLLDVPLPA